MAELQPQSDTTTLDSFGSSAGQPADSGSASSSASGSEPVASLARNLSSSRLNAQAPEFVPTKTPPTPRAPSPVDPRMVIAPPSSPPGPMMHVYPQNPTFHVAIPAQSHLHHPHIHQQQGQQYHHPHHQHQDHHQHQHSGHHQKHHHQFSGGAGEQEVIAQSQQASSHGKDHGSGASSNDLSEEATQKILNQVEFYFSDINLATTDHLIRFIRKDPEGYVPMSVVASFKKIKALISSNAQLAAVLRSSSKLVVNEDGKKVKRLHAIKGPDMEELQCRIIVAENLPEDHCHQNLMKVFSSVGSVKAIRTCQPPPASNGATPPSKPSKADNNMLYCNKLHAFVEYESIELAEKAVAELNDEHDWRNGLRVRLLKRSCKSQQTRGKRVGHEGEETNEEDGTSTSEQIQNERQSEDHSGQSDLHPLDSAGEEQGTEPEGGQKKSRNRSRGKARGRGQNHQNNRGSHHIGSPPTNLAFNNGEYQTVARQPPGPRMPDGTRGFSMGRGKPVTVNTA